jgi:Fe-S-cluster containining protein
MKDFDTEASASLPESTPEARLEGALAKFLEEAAALEKSLSTLSNPVDSDYYKRLAEVLQARILPFYSAYDGYVSAALGMEERPVTCAKSCSGCCRHFVSSVEPFELAALHLHARTLDAYPDMIFSSHKNSLTYEKILAAEPEDDEASDRALYRYFLRGRACPFLEKDGACGVYAYRPMSCRMFFSESAPRFCKGKAIASPWNRNFQIELPEVAEEALARCSERLEALDFPEELFPGMLAANALFGQYDDEAPGS